MFSWIIPFPGPPRTLALAQLTNSVGDGAYYVCSALYFIRMVGLSPTQIGFGLTLGWAVGSVAGVPLGHLADRRGPRGTAVLLAVATGTAVGSFLFVRSFALFVVVACLYASCQCGLSAARQALLAGLVDRARRTEIRSYLQATVNAGLAIGAALGGAALSFDTEEAYLAVLAMDAVSFLLSALVLLRLPAMPPSSAAAPGRPALKVLRDRPYALVSFLNMITLLNMPLLSLVIPLWIVRRTEAPTWTVSALLVLNTLSVVLFQVRVARRVRDLTTASRSVRQAGVVMLASCAVFALSAAGSSVWVAGVVLLVAACLQVFGEMLQASGVWEIGFDLAPPDRQGQYQGFFGTGASVARMLGPLLLTTLIVTWGAPGWLLLGGLFLGAGFAMGPAVRWAERTRAARSAPAAAPLCGGELSVVPSIATNALKVD
ncbi:MFS transporter [Streptosporangium sp. 'caverna']|uniref:MFS transporter n=1 Tax=Streptosporangium sp. 'caverna' TaxID=2202249 RepID=UPI000D7E787D|nr:MFS transporter [Streptosporangium sp. 'caverna']AWS48041.1 MFS transporter [Streptosporangium sp. 'caverna']